MQERPSLFLNSSHRKKGASFRVQKPHQLGGTMTKQAFPPKKLKWGGQKTEARMGRKSQTLKGEEAGWVDAFGGGDLESLSFRIS